MLSTAFDLVNRRCLQQSQRFKHFLPHLKALYNQRSPFSNASAADTRNLVSMKARKADHSSFSNPEEVVVRHSHFGEQPHAVQQRYMHNFQFIIEWPCARDKQATASAPPVLSCRAVCKL